MSLNPPIRPPFNRGYSPAHSGVIPIPNAKVHKKIQRSSFTVLNIVKNVLLIAGLSALHQLDTLGGSVFYIILGIWAITGAENALKALSISFFALIANDFFVPKNFAFTPGRILLVFIVFARVGYDALRYNFPWAKHKYLIALYLFIFAAAILSVINQHFVQISLAKLLLFTMGTTAFLLSAEMLKKGASDMTCWFYSIIIASVALGLLALALGQGYNFRGEFVTVSHFNGPFWHSQTLGPIAGLMIVYLACVFLMTPYRLRWLSPALAIVLLYFLYLSNSRTGLLTLGVGGLTLLLATFFVQAKVGTRLRMTLSKPLIIILLVVGGLSLVLLDTFTGNRIAKAVGDFTLKTADANITLDDIQFQEIVRSREGLIDMMLISIERRPLTGIGFGISMDAGFAERASLFSAPTEKGFLPLAVVEENGAIGALFFLAFLIAFYVKFFQERNIPALVMFTAFLGVNMGEMLFFSFGGQGGFMWLMVAGGILLGERCIVKTGHRTEGR